MIAGGKPAVLPIGQDNILNLQSRGEKQKNGQGNAHRRKGWTAPRAGKAHRKPAAQRCAILTFGRFHGANSPLYVESGTWLYGNRPMSDVKQIPPILIVFHY
jgi:hypothetical protein